MSSAFPRGQGSLEAIGALGMVATLIVAGMTLLPTIIVESRTISERDILDEQIQNLLTDLRAAVEYDPTARQAIASNGSVTYTVYQPMTSGTAQPILMTVNPSASKIAITASANGYSESVEAVVDPEAPAPQSTVLAPAYQAR